MIELKMPWIISNKKLKIYKGIKIDNPFTMACHPELKSWCMLKIFDFRRWMVENRASVGLKPPLWQHILMELMGQPLLVATLLTMTLNITALSKNRSYQTFSVTFLVETLLKLFWMEVETVWWRTYNWA